jgi:D-threo-aldose 1-dehydrogenase
MNPTEKVSLGKTGVKVTRLGIGGCPLGGLYRDLSEEAATATVERALALGLNFFDTAPLYGAGKSESRLGRILAKHHRSTFVLATKVGFALVPIDPNANEEIFFPFENAPPLRPACDYSYDGAMRSFEESLKRLHLDHVDVLHLHEPAGFYDETMQGAFRALLKLREQGLITVLGAAMNQVEMLIRFAHEGGFDCFLLALRHTLLEHWAFKELLPLCAEKQISLIIGAPYSSGILATGAIPGAKYCYLDPPKDVLEKVRQIEAVCQDYSVPLKAAALQFTLCHPAVASVVPGCGSVSEVEENFRMLSYPIPSEFWSELQRRKLVPEQIFIPS